jgi:hypothetical protein
MNGSSTDGPQTATGQIVVANGIHRRYGEGEAAVDALAGVSTVAASRRSWVRRAPASRR